MAKCSEKWLYVAADPHYWFEIECLSRIKDHIMHRGVMDQGYVDNPAYVRHAIVSWVK